MSENSFDIELLGQKLRFPTTWQATIGVTLALAILSATILGAIHLLSHAPIEKLQAVSSVFSQTFNGNDKTTTVAGFRIEFWTPSVKTKEYFEQRKTKTGVDVDDSYKWQVSNDIDRRLDEFGKLLIRDSRIQGYRRNEVLGEGESGQQKWGWWWVIGIQGELSEEYRKWFIETYRQYWGLPKSDTVYLEIVSAPIK